jgi:hypothetical protein
LKKPLLTIIEGAPNRYWVSLAGSEGEILAKVSVFQVARRICGARKKRKMRRSGKAKKLALMRYEAVE